MNDEVDSYYYDDESETCGNCDGRGAVDDTINGALRLVSCGTCRGTGTR